MEHFSCLFIYIVIIADWSILVNLLEKNTIESDIGANDGKQFSLATFYRTVGESEVHNKTQSEVHRKSQTDVHNKSQSEMHNQTQSEAHNKTQSEMYNKTQSEVHNNTQSEVHNQTEELLSCGAFPLDKDEYIMFPNGSAYVEVYNKTYDPPAYSIRGDKLIVCPPEYEEEEDEIPDHGSRQKFDISLIYITYIGFGVSMLCLVLHLVSFFVVPDMRNLPGYNLASLCFSLLLGYVFFIIANEDGVINSGIPCICAAIGLHFFLLSAFFWMSTMSIDVLRSLWKATGKLRLASMKIDYKKYAIYCLYSWGTPLLFVIGALILDNVEGVAVKYRPMFNEGNACWFREKISLSMLFTAPLIIIVLTNGICFGFSAYIIFSNRMRVNDDKSHRSMVRRNFSMHGRLATIMGLTWFIGIFASVLDTIWLWYIFIFLNAFQGFFIFLAFTYTQKVKKHIAKLSFYKRETSTSSVATFQSYCNAGCLEDSNRDCPSEIHDINVEKV